MTSIYYDHKAILGADEKPILNAKHRKHVASVPLDRTFNQESQMSAAPSKRKNRFTNESVGIDSTTGKPTEIYSFKEPLSYQNVKYEDDNVRFLATGKRVRPNNVNNRRYQKFQTATQRISSLNVYPDGTSRQGPSSIPQLEQMIELMQNPPIQATLGKYVPGPVIPSPAGSLGNLSPLSSYNPSRRDSVSSAIDEKGDPIAIDSEELANAITSSILFDKSVDPKIKKDLIEAKFDNLIKNRKDDIVKAIKDAQDFTDSIILEEEKQRRPIPTELLKISKKIKMFEESKFKKNYINIQTNPNKISKINKEALGALSALLISGFYTGDDTQTNLSAPATPTTPSLTSSNTVSPKASTPIAKAPSPKAPNPQKTLLSISPTSLSDSKEQSPKAPSPKALSPISTTSIDKLIAKIMGSKKLNETDYTKLMIIIRKNKNDIIDTLEMQDGNVHIAKELQSFKDEFALSSKAESKDELQNTGKAEAEDFIKKNKLNDRDSFKNFIDGFNYIKKSQEEQYQIRKQYIKVYNDKNIKISDLQIQKLLETEKGRIKMVYSILIPYSQIGSNIYNDLKNDNKNDILDYSLGKLEELTIPDLNDILEILTTKYNDTPFEKQNFEIKEYKKLHQARILVLTLLKGDKEVDIEKINNYSTNQIKNELFQLKHPLN